MSSTRWITSMVSTNSLVKITVLVLAAEAVNLAYIRVTYSAVKTQWYFPLLAMVFGSCIQFFWASAARLTQTNTQTTMLGVIWDSTGFLLWSLLPIVFFSSRFNVVGYTGLLLVLIGTLMVGLQGAAATH